MFNLSYPAKWWFIEIAFHTRLNTRQTRRLRALMGEWVRADRDGVPLQQWPDKWPSIQSGRDTLSELSALGVSYRWRSAPYGRDCACEPGCELGSNVYACDPEWTADDWHTVDPGACS